MNNKATSMIFGALAVFLPLCANAAECDFQKEVGSCSGSIKILSSGGSKPSYSAEIRVASSAPTCSKVEYYLDNTPNVTVLKSSNSEDESLFGTKPISRKNLVVKNCTTYASVGDTPQQRSTEAQPTGEDPYACMKRHSAYVKERQRNRQRWIGLMEFCPL